MKRVIISIIVPATISNQRKQLQIHVPGFLFWVRRTGALHYYLFNWWFECAKNKQPEAFW